MPAILSICVSLPKFFGTPGAANPHDRPWATGFFKEPVPGPVRAHETGLVGDGQADLANHGGPDKAVLAYAATHYPGWRSELGRPDLPFGAFGENFTIGDIHEADVCVGDVWATANVVFEVSQPRQPCWKLARRWRQTDLPARVVATGRSGWYLRVVRGGEVSPGDAVSLVGRPNPEWTIARANRVMYRDRHESAALAAVSGLSASWREEMRDRSA